MRSPTKSDREAKIYKAKFAPGFNGTRYNPTLVRIHLNYKITTGSPDVVREIADMQDRLNKLASVIS